MLAAGPALRSSWCWPRSASYATPRCHAQMRLASPVVKFSWLAAKLSSAKSGQGRQMASCHARPSWPKPARRPRPPKVSRLRSSPIACQSPACTGCMRKDARRCTCLRGQSVPLRVECARRQEHERRGAAGRNRTLSRIERKQLRSPAAGLSSARQCAHGRDQPG